MNTVGFWVLFVVWTIIAMGLGGYFFYKFVTWYCSRRYSTEVLKECVDKYYGDKED